MIAPEQIQEIYNLLKKSGIDALGVDSSSSYLIVKDPNCIVHTFETFAGVCWVFATVITAVLIFGWAISMIRGAKNDLMTNARNLIIIFGTITAVMPIVRTVYGKEISDSFCKKLQIPLSDLSELLQSRNQRMSKSTDLYEQIDIFVEDATSTTQTTPPDLEGLNNLLEDIENNFDQNSESTTDEN